MKVKQHPACLLVLALVIVFAACSKKTSIEETATPTFKLIPTEKFKFNSLFIKVSEANKYSSEFIIEFRY